jgi:hypothetical protein
MADTDPSDVVHPSSGQQQAKDTAEPTTDSDDSELLLADLLGRSDTEPIFERLTYRDEGVDAIVKQLRHPPVFGAGVTGGDPDDDWYQAEVVGEEAVGGQNPTPDQNVTEDLLNSMGLDSIDGRPVRTLENLWERDRDRWELNPESSEDYPEHNR